MASGEPRTRHHTDPYLSSLSGDAAERVTIMKWARYLGATFGTTGALRALRYYRDVNWISDSVRRTMTEYVRGLPIEDLDRQEDTDPSLTDALSSLEGTHFEEHAKSLEFIAAIADDNIEHSLASLQLTENGSLGTAGTGGDLGDRSADLFTAPGFDTGEGDPETPWSADSPEESDRPRRSTGAGADVSDRRPDRDPTREPSPTGSESSRSNVRTTAPRGDRSSVEPKPGNGGSPGLAGDEAVSASREGTHAEGSSSTERGSQRDESSSREGPSDGGDTASNGVSSPDDATGTDDDEDATGADADDDEDATGVDAETEVESRTTTDGDVPPDEERCIALTRDGKRCSRRAMDGSDYCKQHAP